MELCLLLPEYRSDSHYLELPPGRRRNVARRSSKTCCRRTSSSSRRSTAEDGIAIPLHRQGRRRRESRCRFPLLSQTRGFGHHAASPMRRTWIGSLTRVVGNRPGRWASRGHPAGSRADNGPHAPRWPLTFAAECARRPGQARTHPVSRSAALLRHVGGVIAVLAYGAAGPISDPDTWWHRGWVTSSEATGAGRPRVPYSLRDATVVRDPVDARDPGKPRRGEPGGSLGSRCSPGQVLSCWASPSTSVAASAPRWRRAPSRPSSHWSGRASASARDRKWRHSS